MFICSLTFYVFYLLFTEADSAKIILLFFNREKDI